MDSLGLTGEQAVLIRAIWPEGGGKTGLEELIHPGLDWQKLINLAASQGVLPLLHNRLQTLPPGIIPPQAAQQLRAIYQPGAHRSLRLALRLLHLVDLLSKQGIETLAMKGPALAVQAYGALELRTYCDLDVLIHRENFPRAYEVLTQAGYQPDFPLANLIEQRRLQETDKDFKFTIQGDTFEIHWEISDKQSFQPMKIEQFWKNPASINLLGQEIRTFSPENAIWMACLHGTKHAWEQLKWISDLAHLVQAFPEMDWPAIFDDAQQTGFQRLLCTSLLLAQDPGGAALPAVAAARLDSEPKAVALAGKARAWVLNQQAPLQQFDRMIFFIQNRERWRDHLRYWWAWFFIPTRADALHRALRPLRLLGSCTRAFCASLIKMR